MSAELHFKSVIKTTSAATDRYEILIWQQSGSFTPSTLKHEKGGGSVGVHLHSVLISALDVSDW